MSRYVVIVDGLGVAKELGSRPGERLDYRVLARGKEYTAEELGGDERVKELLDEERHPPFGAIAPTGSKAAKALSSPTVVHEDPAETQRRLRREIAGDALMLDPAQEDANEPKSTPSPDVARAVAAQADAPAGAASGRGSGANLDDLKKEDLQRMAKGLGLSEDGKVDELRARIRDHVAATGGKPEGDDTENDQRQQRG